MTELEYINKRFSGINRIYKEDSLEKLSKKKVAVIGIGGVGSWCVEGLVRSGIGNITLFDFDNISISNTNRQLHAVSENYGKPKTLAMQERIYSINRYCNVEIIEEFINADNIELLKHNFDYIIDASDDIKAKIEIAVFCTAFKIPFIICGAAGGKKDPRLIKINILSNVQYDPLLAKLRYILRKKNNFGEKIKIDCIYSTEAKNNPNKMCFSAGLSCDGYGSVVGITASMGFMAAQYALNSLLL